MVPVGPGREARARADRQELRDLPGPARARSPAPVAAAVYDYLQRWTRGAFPALPEDRIAAVYGVVDEDFEEVLIELSRRSGCPEGALAHLPEIGTVADLAGFLTDCGRRGAAGDGVPGYGMRSA